MCLHFREWYVRDSMELGPEDVSLLERCLVWYVQASMELGPEDVSLLENWLGRPWGSTVDNNYRDPLQCQSL